MSVHRSISKLSVFIISFLLGGISKLSGFFRTYTILRILGTTVEGDLFNSAYNWPNLLRRITVDGALSYSILPFLLEVSKSHNSEEFNRRVTKSILFFTVITAVLSGIFWILATRLQYKSLLTLDKSIVIKIHQLFILLMIPLALMGIYTTALNSKEDFQFANIVSAVGNVIFLVSALILKFFVKDGLYIIWGGLMINGMSQVLFLYFRMREKNINISPSLLINKNKPISVESFTILPPSLLVTIGKSFIIQICSRINSVIFGMLIIQYNIGRAGLLIAANTCDRLIVGAISIFAITVATISTPIFFRAINHKEHQDIQQSREIILATLVCGAFISMICFFMAKPIVYFLFGKHKNINNDLIHPLLKISAWQVLLNCTYKILQTITIAGKMINFSLYGSMSASIISSLVMWYAFPKMGIYALLLSQYIYLIMEIIILFTAIVKEKKTRILFQNIITFSASCILGLKMGLLCTILLGIRQLLNTGQFFINNFRKSMLIMMTLYLILGGIILFNHVKIFILKSKQKKI